MKRITFTLNGERRYINVETNETLLELLRDKLGIKSPKSGCEKGDCGACSVLLNGKSVRSCLILGVEVDQEEVITIEGLSKNGPAEIQKAFIKHNSFQCGYCAPGVIISTTELLNRKSNPNENEIKEALSGNLCRCTGYTPIIEAIKSLGSK